MREAEEPGRTSAGPVTPAARYASLDVVRGVAVLGILLMNIWAFAGPQAYFDYPVGLADRSGAPVATWAVVHSLFEGSQRGLFSLLFGAGVLLMLSRLIDQPGVPAGRIYYRRMFLLLTIGLVDAFVLLWPADILVTYALCGMLLYPLRRVSIPVLLGLSLVVVAANAGLRYADLQESRELRSAYRQAVQSNQDVESAADTIAAWGRIEDRARPDVDSDATKESIRIIGSGSLGEFYRERAKSSLILQTVVALNAWFLDALAVMLLGMAALRSGLLTGQVSRGWLIGLLVGGYGIGLALSISETTALLAADFDPLVKKSWLIVYDLRRLAVAAGHLGLVLLVCQSGALPWLRARLAAVGRMALSNYLGQSILGGLIFYTVGLGLFGQFTGAWLYVVVGLIWVLQIFVSHWWLEHYRFGPAEWLWRSLTYRRKQAFRRQVTGQPYDGELSW